MLLLSDPDIPVTEAALQSGFSSLSTFLRVFRSVKQCTPTEFRDMYIHSENCRKSLIPAAFVSVPLIHVTTRKTFCSCFLRFPSSNDSHDSGKEPDLLFPLQSDSFSAVIQNRSNRLLLQYFLFGDTTVAFPLFLSANKSCTSASVKPTYGAILPASIMHHWTSK